MSICVFAQQFVNDMTIALDFLASWFILTLCRSLSKIKVRGHNSRS